ncbi:heterogeneous nuclear ribonucleoprotein K homolog [Dysidea avara]|uniref:heterogeneous nuclear ribonucleoprotein K homolog n=1 Tax=Dysidea avara TaxID=196820 RepID=UPI003316CDA0
MEGAPRGGMPRGGGPFGRKRERGDWGDASFGNPPPNKIPRPRIGEESLRILTRSSDAGSIIGKGGSNIKRLRQQYNCTLHYPECPGSNERVLTINGARNSIISCMEELIPKINESVHRGAPNFTTEVQVLVPEPYMGTIIGTGGQKIKQQRKESNAAIKIFSESLPGSNERSISITGGKAAILSCVAYVLSELGDVMKNENRGPTFHYIPSGAPFDPFMEFPPPPQVGRGSPRNLPPNFSPGPRGGGWGGRGGRGRGRGGGNPGRGDGGRGYGGGGGAGGGQMGNNQQFSSPGAPPPQQFKPPGPTPLVPSQPGGPSGTAIQTQQVTIPNQYADAILGPGGSRLDQTVRQSGCEITMDSGQPGSSERVINIKGLPNNIQVAQTLMQNNVRQFHNLPMP